MACDAGLSRVLRQGSRVPADDALSAAGRHGQRRRARQDVRRGDGRRRVSWPTRRAAAKRFRAARARAGAIDETPRRASRAVLPEGHQPQGDARSAATGASSRDSRSACAKRIARVDVDPLIDARDAQLALGNQLRLELLNGNYELPRNSPIGAGVKQSDQDHHRHRGQDQSRPRSSGSSSSSVGG